MLTRLVIRNFKLFDEVEIELGDRVLFVGPNNSGKSSALQALALWSVGVRRWVEKRGDGNVPKQRSGVAINRRDLIAVPVPAADLLWRDSHLREQKRDNGKRGTHNVLIEVAVDGVDESASWSAGLEFDYANEESFYCRARTNSDGSRSEIPRAAADAKIAFLPPMSGLVPNEPKLDEGAIAVRLGEGRTAEVLRNLCWLTSERDPDSWYRIVAEIERLFGAKLESPRYVKERGEIEMMYTTKRDTRLDLSCSGRGQQQTLLLLAHMANNPGSVLLLDEPDAHLEILRQRQIYSLLCDSARATNCQIIAASHSEVVLNEAGDRDVVVAFVGKPHRIDDRGRSQVRKALKEIGFDQYLQAEESRCVFYFEGSTDFEILRALANRMGHPARSALENAFVHFVGNHPPNARTHFHGLREAVPELVGFALYDRLEGTLTSDPNLKERMWKKREIENYLSSRETLLRYARERALREGEIYVPLWTREMEASIDEIVDALKKLRMPDPWGPDIKASDEFLDRVFENFFERLKLPNLMRKSDYHELARLVDADEVDPEVIEVLDEIAALRGRVESRHGPA